MTQNEKLAKSLEFLHDLQAHENTTVFQVKKFTRVHRDRLIRHGYLKEVVKGWVMVADPSSTKGDSTSWYASFWTFIQFYLNQRFSDDYCLSAEASMLFHTGSTTIPKKLTVITKKQSGQILNLPYGTTLLLYHDVKNLPKDPIEKEGIWMMSIEEALCRIPPSYFEKNSLNAELALRSLKNVSKLLDYLLSGKHSTIAGRLIGAYQFLGETKTAQLIQTTMKAADYLSPITNPFSSNAPILGQGFRFRSPYCARIQSLWVKMKAEITEIFPDIPTTTKDPFQYMKKIEEVYATDAYNSLSIEGYQVTPDLIEQIRSGQYHPDQKESDVQQYNAMAAKGYYLAFQEVKKTISRILERENAGKAVEKDHSSWYLELFSPIVQAGLLKVHQLSGYRNHPVFIRQSLHIPPPASAIPDCMETYFDLLTQEDHLATRVILGHFIFVYIHPYSDGNGRIARFLMNCMLASGNAPWCVVPLNKRYEYMSSLEKASCEENIKDFALFIKNLLSTN